MPTLTEHLRILLVRDLQTAVQELELFPDDESVWKTMPGVTNAAGNLAAHLAGNLQHFIGARLGGTGYVRNRDFEFSRTSGTRAELTAELQKTSAMLERVVPTLTDGVLEAPYPDTFSVGAIRTDLFLLHLSTHLAMHVGQIGYLRRILLADPRSTGPVPMATLATRDTPA
jgi:hypothetical protein